MTDTGRLRRILLGADVALVTGLVVLPFAATWVSPRFATPLTLPGYLVYTIGSAVGNLIAPNFALWVYWVPFLLAAYVLGVLGAGAGRVAWARVDDGR